MNIFLVPFTWLRHLSMAFWCAGAGLMAWWAVLAVFMLGGPNWPPGWDGPILVCGISGAVAGASLLGEGNLRRQNLFKRAALVLLGVALTVGLTLAWYLLWHLIALNVLFTGDLEPDATDTSLVSLTFRLGAFAMGGVSCGMGPLFVRKGAGMVSHLTGGIASGLAGGGAWHLLNSTEFNTDLYLAGAGLGVTWGFVYGLMVWGIPDELYAGWVRVLTPNRFGRRIPIDAREGGPKERFVGHFPRGLDLFLPLDDGVMELHVSFAVDSKHRYAVRGLSLAPTTVKRFLERVDLRYDPRRPAPLETRIASGDRIRVSTYGDGYAELEFVMLPREEK